MTLIQGSLNIPFKTVQAYWRTSVSCLWFEEVYICVLGRSCSDPTPPSSFSPSWQQQEGLSVSEKQGHISETLSLARETLSKEQVENIHAAQWATVISL